MRAPSEGVVLRRIQRRILPLDDLRTERNDVDRTDVRGIDRSPNDVRGEPVLVLDAERQQALRYIEARLLPHPSNGGLVVRFVRMWRTGDSLPETTTRRDAPQHQEMSVATGPREQMDRNVSRHAVHDALDTMDREAVTRRAVGGPHFAHPDQEGTVGPHTQATGADTSGSNSQNNWVTRVSVRRGPLRGVGDALGGRLREVRTTEAKHQWLGRVPGSGQGR